MFGGNLGSECVRGRGAVTCEAVEGTDEGHEADCKLDATSYRNVFMPELVHGFSPCYSEAAVRERRQQQCA